MKDIMKMAKLKALRELIGKMRKEEGKPYAGEETPDEEMMEEEAEDVVDPIAEMKEDDGEDFESEKKKFMKRGMNSSTDSGKTKAIMMSVAIGKPKGKKS